MGLIDVRCGTGFQPVSEKTTGKKPVPLGTKFGR
jgi:hypothetical protein